MGSFVNRLEIIESWEMLEYIERHDAVKYTPDNMRFYRERAEYLEGGFRARNNEKVKELRQRAKDQFVHCGFVTDVEMIGDYAVFDIKQICGSTIGYELSSETLLKSGYIPREGDRVTLIYDNSLRGKDKSESRESFYLRKDGHDVEIYNNYPDRLARKEQELNEASSGLKGSEKDIARYKLYKTMLQYKLR